MQYALGELCRQACEPAVPHQNRPSIFPIGRRLPQTRFLNVAIGTIVTQKKRYTRVYRARLGEIIETMMTTTRSLVQRQQHAKHHDWVLAVIETEPTLPWELRVVQVKEPATDGGG